VAIYFVLPGIFERGIFEPEIFEPSDFCNIHQLWNVAMASNLWSGQQFSVQP
jgi:hypothetical protein